MDRLSTFLHLRPYRFLMRFLNLRSSKGMFIQCRACFLFLGIALLMLASCSESKPSRPVTIAFPLGTYSSTGAILEFQDMLVEDGKHMVRDSRIEGLPKPVMTVQLDPARLQLFTLVDPISKAEIFAKLPTDLPWQVSADSLTFTAIMDDPVGSTPLQDLEQRVISPVGAVNVVQFRDVAQFKLEQKIDPVIVDGQKCIVIQGTTTRDETEVQDWLRGTDKRLGVQFFVVVED